MSKFLKYKDVSLDAYINLDHVREIERGLDDNRVIIFRYNKDEYKRVYCKTLEEADIMLADLMLAEI